MGKKITALVLAALMLTTLGACGAKKDQAGSKPEVTLQQVVDRKAYIVGFADNFMPFGYKDANGTYRGFDLDVAKEIAKRLGVTLNLQTVSAENAVSMLKSASVDYLGNSFAIPNEKDSDLAFSDSILEVRQVIVVNDDSSAKAKSDLAGKKVGVMKDSRASAALSGDKSFDKKITRVELNDRTKAADELTGGKIDALVIDETWARNLIKGGRKLRILDKELKTDEYCLVFRKADREVRERIDKILEEMEKDGTLDSLTQDWFGMKYEDLD